MRGVYHTLGLADCETDSVASEARNSRTGRVRHPFEWTVFLDEKIFAGMHFFLACRSESCILRMRTRFTPRESERRLRRTRVKIEFFIAARPVTFPNNFPSEDKDRQADALAPCGCDIFHGVWRDVWDRRNYQRRGVWARDFDFAVLAGAVVFADCVHDRRALERAAF